MMIGEFKLLEFPQPPARERKILAEVIRTCKKVTRTARDLGVESPPVPDFPENMPLRIKRIFLDEFYSGSPPWE